MRQFRSGSVRERGGRFYVRWYGADGRRREEAAGPDRAAAGRLLLQRLGEAATSRIGGYPAGVTAKNQKAIAVFEGKIEALIGRWRSLDESASQDQAEGAARKRGRPPSANVLHEQAMVVYDRSLSLRSAGKQTEAVAALRAALELETAAAERLRHRKEAEPSRGILYRSAATLAVQVGDFETAESLVLRGLDGSPPPYVAGELKSLLRNVRRRRRGRVAGNSGDKEWR